MSDQARKIRPVVRLRRKNIPKDELIQDLRRVALMLGKKSVSYCDYDAEGHFSKNTLAKRFGSWTAALDAADLQHGVIKIKDNDALFENLLKVWTKLGRQPRYAEMRRPLSLWSIRPYELRFGSWNNALVAFSRFVDVEVDDKSSVPTPNQQQRDSHRRTPRFPNLRLRWNVLKRDSFRCKCGRCPATDDSVVLHVDHVTAWTNGGETVLDNLQTLCERCNLGKGDL